MRSATALLVGLAAAVNAAAADLRVNVSDVAGSPVKQVRAEAVLDARAGALFAAISDVERYATFMPYVVESRIAARDAESIVNYQRLSFGIPFVAPRHYAIRIRSESGADPDGRAVYRVRWTLAPDVPLPSDPNAVAVPVDIGFWHLQDLGGEPPATRVVYCVFTDPGGQLPSWIVNQANAEAVPKVFDAVRKAAKEERYANAMREVGPGGARSMLTPPASCQPNG